jgi:hypothetical protein
MLPGYPAPGWATTQVYPAREATPDPAKPPCFKDRGTRPTNRGATGEEELGFSGVNAHSENPPLRSGSSSRDRFVLLT